MASKAQPTSNALLEDPWLVLGNYQFHSRLLFGLEQYSSVAMIRQILEAGNAQVLITTFDLEGSRPGILFSDLANAFPPEEYIWIGTTSFAKTAEEAITVAKMLKQSLDLRIIKLDVRREHNVPDNKKTVEVAKTLLSEGFYILPFIFPEQKVARELEDAGCSALRVMASPIGSGRGIVNIEAIQSVINSINIPVIVEGGLRSATDVTLAMELGASAALVNAALVKAQHPIVMATAMKHAVAAGRLAFLAGMMAKTS
jgi:thiazole synthase